ncbi:unnamed protein product [Protopolystoma xenopodis]|uniref:Uncharacterized protein n=1 Tax=Protopolystoma xenopodis TaxID=117903 RepID=A0A3S5BFR5_9PLAT|nr:unnamed protein product [Protopolystoma xenopodis]
MKMRRRGNIKADVLPPALVQLPPAPAHPVQQTPSALPNPQILPTANLPSIELDRGQLNSMSLDQSQLHGCQKGPLQGRSNGLLPLPAPLESAPQTQLGSGYLGCSRPVTSTTTVAYNLRRKAVAGQAALSSEPRTKRMFYGRPVEASMPDLVTLFLSDSLFYNYKN